MNDENKDIREDGYDAGFSLGYAPDEWLRYGGYNAQLKRYKNDYGDENMGQTKYYYAWNVYRPGTRGRVPQFIGSLYDVNPSPIKRNSPPGSLMVSVSAGRRDAKFNFEGNIKDAIDYLHILTMRPAKPSKK